ncbi:MAG: cell wall anchor protein [Muribaculum sp.]|nr:cell wall anchor protein [Muribaculum sp.]
MNTLKHIRFLITLVLITFAGISTTEAASPSIKIALDSAYLLMGKATPLHVELVKDAKSTGQLLIPKDSVCDKVEILRILDADTSDIGSDRQEIKIDVLLQSFDSGMYRLNPIRYVENGETIASNQLALKVLPAVVDSLETIHDYADIADVDRNFIDYLPDFIVDYGLWILALIIVLAIAGYIIYVMTKKKNPFVAAKAKPVPPYERAMADLNALRNEKLCEQGRERDYYTRITDILRVYLHGRFGINAMEMTSTQIRHSLQANEGTRLSKKYMDQVLEIADFVKFAKVHPLPDDNVKAFNSAMQFVEDTKPLPEPDPDKEKEEDASGNSENENQN